MTTVSRFAAPRSAGKTSGATGLGGMVLGMGMSLALGLVSNPGRAQDPGAAVSAGGELPAAPPDCAALLATATTARRAGDAEAARQALAAAGDCDGETRARLGRATAQACFDRLRASGRSPAEAEADLRGCLAYGREWRARIELADLAYDRGDFDQAARDYDEALSVIGNPALVPTPPPAAVLARLTERGDRARLLAPGFRRSARAADGTPDGLGRLGTRGFEPVRRQLPIGFAFGSDTFTADGAAAAGELRDALARDCHGPVRLVGHTDSVGADAYNLRLSRRRAGFLLNYLRQVPLPADCRLTAEGVGGRQPPLLDDPARYTPDQQRQLARRVELLRAPEPAAGPEPDPNATAPAP